MTPNPIDADPLPPGPNRWKERSRTLPNIAAAIAAQWGGVDAAQEAA